MAKKGGEVLYHDPYIGELTTEEGRGYTNSPLTDELLESVDCVVITTNHSCFDVERIVERARLVVDLRNAVKTPSEKVYKL